MISSAQAKRDQQTDAVETLRSWFPIGSTVQTKLLHVSRSGMLRSFSVLVSAPGSEAIRDVSRLVADAIGAKVHQPTGGVAMGGAGMDMGYALTYSLSHALYRDGFPCTGSDGTDGGTYCPSNDHTNERSRAPYRATFTRGRMHSDPGYALGHRHI